MKYIYKKKKDKKLFVKSKNNYGKINHLFKKKNEEGRSKFLSLVLCPM
jgi:hypothetical protein